MKAASLPWNRFRTGTAALAVGEESTALPEHGSQARREPLIILGAGLAGCWLARLLAERGIGVTLIDANDSVASAASGNPAGIVKPYVTRMPCPAMAFHVQAHASLIHHLHSLPNLARSVSGEEQLRRCGVLQLVNKAYSPSADYRSLDTEQADTIAGLALNSPALHFADSGWLNPGQLCQSLVAHPGISLECGMRVLGFTRESHSDNNAANQPLWRISLHKGQPRWTTRLVLACGAAINTFEQTGTLPVVAARGQMSRFALRSGSAAPRCVINGKHYLIPDGDTVVVGATFDRGVHHVKLSDEDHARNLAGLRATVSAIQVHEQALSGRAGVRATTPDRLPIAGPAPDMSRVNEAYAELKHGRAQEQYPSLPCHEGLYLLGGLGSRGIVTAPLAAEWLADRLMSDDDKAVIPSSGVDWVDLLNPARFRLRDLKRGIVERT